MSSSRPAGQAATGAQEDKAVSAVPVGLADNVHRDVQAAEMDRPAYRANQARKEPLVDPVKPALSGPKVREAEIRVEIR